MDELLEKSQRLLVGVESGYQRSTLRPINWQWQLNGIIGARGTGKTTLLLQQLRKLQQAGNKVLYATLDDLYFTDNRLYTLAIDFYKQGGNYLFLDEIHKYPSWSRELKNLYDTVPELKITFSGSSITEITRQDVDLSRRALFYELPGLSFREYLLLAKGLSLASVSLPELLRNHMAIAADLTQLFRPIEQFKAYLQHGYYPYFMEKERDYQLTLEQTLQLVVEIDMKYQPGFDPSKSRKLLQLLKVIAASAPFKPNISKLSERININRNTLVQYLHYLEKAQLIRLLHVPDKDISVLQKPDKIFLNNTNLQYVLNSTQADVGSMRETFLASQVSPKHELHLHRQADFIIDHHYIIEVGGKSKASRQITGLPDAYLAVDNLEIGNGHRIPLWLFGMLY
ncbi:MAG: AAA family ATPase [Tunicatimonas sp.]